MSSQDIGGLREQILANARLLLRSSQQPGAENVASTSTAVNGADTIHVIISGEIPKIRGVLMLGFKPVVEGSEAATAEIALRKLLIAVTETAALYLPPMAGHLRAIHSGGTFDEDMIAPELSSQRKSA